MAGKHAGLINNIKKNMKICFTLSICWLFILTDFAVSGENKIEQPGTTSNKISLAKMLKKKFLPWIDERYSMMILGPDCHSQSLDPGIIVMNTLDPGVHAELRVIDPYIKKEITGLKVPPNDSFKNKLWTDELFSMRGIKPDPEIDKEIVKNNFNPNMKYEMNFVNPYLKNQRFGHYRPRLKDRRP